MFATVGAAPADTVDTASTLGGRAVRRWAASDNTVCSSVESFARAIVICLPRRRASVARERICVVASRFVVVAGSPEAVLEAAPPLSAADPPTTAPPTSTAETKIERPLIGLPIALPSSPDRRFAFSLAYVAGTDYDSDPTVLWQRW